ncbi:hypothetical protein [Natronobeatus ordinarius]|uniref:hypothetical protein n=1 Tax=Natronobeatus ordinarius TaxID=2963433 RepID=UPI0020CF093A|nr:hypothetical protein [Natronobeatus ordinarius]
MSGRNDNTDPGSVDNTRRTFLGTVAVSVGFAGFGLGTVVAKSGPSVDMKDFAVGGRKSTTVEIRPEEVVVKTIKQSPELKERYGDDKIQNIETYERPEPERDDLPQEDTIVETGMWRGFVAKEDEWVTLAESDNADQLMFSPEEKNESDIEVNYPDEHPKYYHNNEDNTFVLSGPINLIGSVQFDDADHCASNIASNGTGSYTWTTSVADATRYALTGLQFQAHESSVASGPLGITGRTHGRLWNSSSQVLIAAHEDNWVPHEAVSYKESEERIDSFMESSFNHYDANNAEDPDGNQLLDHDGEVTLVFET